MITERIRAEGCSHTFGRTGDFRTTEEAIQAGEKVTSKRVKNDFFEEGIFRWQLISHDREKTWRERCYSEERWWGDFPRNLKVPDHLFESYPWAIGPFHKYAGNPILRPTPGGWDCGHVSGGVHNGAVIIKDDTFYYIYRGERPIDVPTRSPMDYICDIGIATSKDGIHFTKDLEHSPIFRRGDRRKYSYEDVSIALFRDTYHLFCNQWFWDDMINPSFSGVFHAVSTDLLNWEPLGILFPDARRIHRNPVILVNPVNEAVAVDGQFILYINDGLVAYSDDMFHWQSKEIEHHWPGGEGCFALADYNKKRPDDIILFTGGHHTGHFYAIGEVLFSKSNPEQPLEYLPRPVLEADSSLSYENGYSADEPQQFITSWADTVFFTGMTLRNGRWWVYYGGSEYYTCLATARAEA